MAEWSAGQVGLHFIPAGEPWRNGYIESFNSRIRDECLNITSSPLMPSQVLLHVGSRWQFVNQLSTTIQQNGR